MYNVEYIKTYLKSNSYVAQPASDQVDGKDYIELSKSAKSELGKMLSITHQTLFETPIGKFNSIKTFMEFITTPDYPIDLLTKHKLTSEDIKRIPKKKVGPSNYWALVAMATYFRIKSDVDLQTRLKESTLDFTAMGANVTGELFGTKITMLAPNKRLGKYIGFLRIIKEAIKNDSFTEEFAKNLVEAAKEVPEKDLFDGVPFTVYQK